MMKNYFLLVLFLLLGLPIVSFGQGKDSKASLLAQMRYFQNEQEELRPDNFFRQKAKDFDFASDSKMILQKKEKGFQGTEHLKYQQYHQGIPVFGATYILHCQHGKVKSSNGYFRPQIDIDLSTKISAQQALQIAQSACDAKTYIWEAAAPAPLKNQHHKPVPQLFLIDPAYPEVSEKVVLAYRVDLYSWEPLDKQQYFIDAQNGKVIAQFPLLATHAVPATGETHYYGTQNIIVDSVAPHEFYLRDLSRGQGIHTFDAQKNLFQNNSTYWNLQNEARDEVAIDAHYCTEKNYDLLLQKFQWNGIDNQGGSMNSLVHLNNGANIVNAFWDGSMALFGDGDCSHSPLTTFEIIGHEFMHGIIQHSSQLIYQDESGAINESLADVFGKLLEYTESPNDFQWDIGHSFQLHDGDPPFRSMSDPKAFGNPAFYRGEHWIDGGFVHNNSGVGNHWFYLLSEGKNGVNENNEAYDVKGIGIEKAAEIVFLCNRAYLVEDSDYLAYYQSSMEAAEELFGPASSEVLAVKEAWKAVGLPATNPHSIDLALSIPMPFQEIRTCQYTGYIATQCVLTNVGQESYIPKSNDFLKANSLTFTTNQSISIPLTEALAPGASQIFSFDTLIFIDQEEINSTHNYNIEIEDDQNADNDWAYGRFKNDIYDKNALWLVYAETEQYDCQSASHLVRSFIRNQGCETFASNTPFQILLQDSQQVTYWSETIQLDQDLLPGRFIDLEHALSFSPEDHQDYVLALLVPDNPIAVEDNRTKVTFWSQQTISIDYKNDFELGNDLEIKAQIKKNTDQLLYNLGNETYWMTTGERTTFSGNPCFYPEKEMERLFGSLISGIMTFCADFSAVDYPVVAFDLIQYRNDQLAEPFDASSMMQVSWAGNESGHHIIYAQEEGKLLHHRIPLPSHFMGQLEFKFLNYTGTDFTDSTFLDFDLNLMDNLSFFNDPTLGIPPTPKSSIQIFPNPVLDQLQIKNESGKEIQSVNIINTQGKSLYLDNKYNRKLISTSFLPNGYYWLSILTTDQTLLNLPFVKCQF